MPIKLDDPITIMVSSTIKDMLSDRKAVIDAFSELPFVQIIGAEPIKNRTYSSSPYLATIDMAKNCDFFILLLGYRYGYEIRSGKSATEVEFDAAYEDNPTKILIFQKEYPEKQIEPEPEQKRFIAKVSDYYKGYWVTKYNSVDNLKELVLNSFFSLLKERASIGFKLSYFDHFIRCVIQRKIVPNIQVFYAVKEDLIEIEYKIFGRSWTIHFNKQQVYKDFWGCVAYLEEQIKERIKNG